MIELAPPLDGIVFDLAHVASVVDARLLLVGAHARDLCLGTPEEARKTRDVDFAAQLSDWAHLDAFFDGCEGRFRSRNKRELTMIHSSTGVIVDIGPCGGVESPLGRLELRGSTRKLNTTGLQECFELGKMNEPTGRVLMPPPMGFIILKLFAFLDRRQPHDLRDLGYVLRRIPFNEDAIWEDKRLMAAFEDQEMTYEDVPYWMAGRAIRRDFSAATASAVLAALDALSREKSSMTYQIVSPGVNALGGASARSGAAQIIEAFRSGMNKN